MRHQGTSNEMRSQADAGTGRGRKFSDSADRFGNISQSTAQSALNHKEKLSVRDSRNAYIAIALEVCNDFSGASC